MTGLDLEEPVDTRGPSRFYKGDVRCRESLIPALEKVKCVIHLAAVHFDYGHRPEEYWDTNENGTKELITAVKESGINKFIFYSTIAVYGDHLDESSEQTQTIPTSPYGKSKLAAEEIIRNWTEEKPHRSTVILRPCAVYGEQNITNMNNLIRQIHSGFFVRFGPGNNIKATAYVGNLIKATQYCLERMEPGLKIFDYADKPDLTVNDIVSIIHNELDKKLPTFTFPLWLGRIAAMPFSLLTILTGRNFPVNVKRVKKLTLPTRIKAQKIRDYGFKQVFTCEEGIHRTVQYYLENRNKLMDIRYYANFNSYAK